VVTKLDRLGRSLENLIDLSKTLQERGVDLVGVTDTQTHPLHVHSGLWNHGVWAG